jgi:hypothetical protein
VQRASYRAGLVPVMHEKGSSDCSVVHVALLRGYLATFEMSSDERSS